MCLLFLKASNTIGQLVIWGNELLVIGVEEAGLGSTDFIEVRNGKQSNTPTSDAGPPMQAIGP